MRSEIPVFRQITLDLDRSARELAVFWAACELLDVVEPRTLTLKAVQTKLQQLRREAAGKECDPVSTSTVSHALTRLEEAGYLVREVGADGRERYRVPLSRRPEATTEVEYAPRSRPRIRAAVLSEAIR